ncbi:cation acetate symporter [Nocardia vinacea]|uniref:Cation acetate symporter n=1 Tax=Nocardia vinacea TaxID=96468 RepID=A0ABZ1YNX6_9NOCA|nr:cation acetate symporter [Nocardia vinacea]
MVGFLAVTPVALMTLLIGLRGVAAMRTTSDFLVASRQISPLLNSAAVAGEYISAASFLGVPGLVVKDGIGALWYPVGFAAGYVAMLVLVAAPMRRAGALTVPDFAEARLASPALRRLAVIVVLVIGALYVVPQFRTSGLVLSVVSGTPYWVGVVLVGVAVAATLALGGMRAATYVQAFQFVLKVVLFVVPAIWLLVSVGSTVRAEAVRPVEFTHFVRDTPVVFRVDTTIEVTEPAAGLGPGTYHLHSGETLYFRSGEGVPRVDNLDPPGGAAWQRPMLDLGHDGHSLLGTLAVLIATVFGTTGLPHVIMRFHTSPDGRAARRTAALTVVLLSCFYVFLGVYGVLGSVLMPQLYLSGATDTVVVALPMQVDTGWVGTLVTGLLTAGAFAAFLGTSLGLLLAMSGAISHDITPSSLGRLRVTVLGTAAVLVLLALFAAQVDAGVLVTWSFTVAASTFSPLLILGIWWPRLTALGAVAGVLAGLFVSSGLIAVALFGPPPTGLPATLVAQPAPLSVPLAFLTMVVVSQGARPPAWGSTAMLRLHLNERNRSSRSADGSWTVRRTH